MVKNDFGVHLYNGQSRCKSEAWGSGLISALDFWARSTPNAPFLTAVSESGSIRTVSFQEFSRYTRRIGSWYQRHCKLSQGDVIALPLRNDIESVVGVIGAVRVGLPVGILNPDDPPSRQELISNVIGSAMTFDALPRCDDLKDASLKEVYVNAFSDVFYFGTSGSTADSKVVAQTHVGVATNAIAMRRHHQLSPGDRFLGCLPICHVNGFHFSIIAAIYSGTQTILAAAFDPFSYPQLLDTFQPRIASVVPTILNALLSTYRSNAMPSCFEYFVSAAAPLERQIAVEFYERWGTRVLQGYGLTEAINFSATMPVGLSDDDYRRLVLQSDQVPVGVALYGNEIVILNRDCVKQCNGTRGEICIRGFNVMDRYVGNGEATKGAFRDGYFHTGDLGQLQVDQSTGGQFLTIHGRLKNVAKVGGVLVSLEEIESALLELEVIQDAACVVEPHPISGDCIIAKIVTAIVGDIHDEVIMNQLREVLSPVALPSNIIRVTEIPRSPTGKILRCQLGELN